MINLSMELRRYRSEQEQTDRAQIDAHFSAEMHSLRAKDGRRLITVKLELAVQSLG